MRSLWRGKTGWLVIGGSVAVITAAVLLTQAYRPSAPAVATTNARQKYAALYQAAWRQDDGQHPILVTATLIVPTAQEALGQDTGRSSAEEQIWSALKSLGPDQVPVILTFDSVAGAVTDEAVRQGAVLSADHGPQFSLASWQPMIAPSRIVNTATSASSQIGVAIFQADRTIDWQTLTVLRLTIDQIDGAQRVFTWTQPRLLLNV